VAHPLEPILSFRIPMIFKLFGMIVHLLQQHPLPSKSSLAFHILFLLELFQGIGKVDGYFMNHFHLGQQGEQSCCSSSSKRASNVAKCS
jgi:hypothetical protein